MKQDNLEGHEKNKVLPEFGNWRKFGYLLTVIFLTILYFTETFYMVRNRQFGVDYLAFWSAGKVADTFGYINVYDPELLRNIQEQEISPPLFDLETFEYWPVPYPPVFVLPFQFLSRMEFYPSYWIWVVTNWVVLLTYLWFFTKKISSSTIEIKRNIIGILAVVVSFPTLSNFVWGSMEVLIVIVAGEFIRHSKEKRGIIAGLWLGALFIKPQLLILVIPVLLILQNFDILKGAVCSGVVLAAVSLLLSGAWGILDLLNLWLDSVPGMATNSPDSMMNLRMIGVRLQMFLPASWSWIIAAIGMMGTLYLCWFIIKLKPNFGTKNWIMAMMAVFAATCAVTWHSHIHMAMFLFPFFIFGVLKSSLSQYFFDAWVLGFPFVLIVVIIILLVTSGGISPFLLRFSNYIFSYLFLFLNLVVCLYVFKDVKNSLLYEVHGRN